MKTAAIPTCVAVIVPLFAEAIGGFSLPEIVQTTASGVIATLLTIIVVKLGPAALGAWRDEMRLWRDESSKIREHDSVEREKQRLRDQEERDKQRIHDLVRTKELWEHNTAQRNTNSEFLISYAERIEVALEKSIALAIEKVFEKGLEYGRRKDDKPNETE